ncbi:MAG: adenylate kinase [Christensenellales bacterium]
MNIVLLGAPGAGKGSQAVKIKDEYGIPHISTGDILRENIRKGTELGRQAKSIIDDGGLVSDDIMVEIVRERLSEPDCKKGYILDGFPRTIPQAEELGKFARIEYVFDFEIEFDALSERLGGRRMCVCGETYHISRLNGKNTCAKCGKELYLRDDDKPEAIKKRLAAYREQTEPLIDYYKSKGVLWVLDGKKDIPDLFEDIRGILDK